MKSICVGYKQLSCVHFETITKLSTFYTKQTSNLMLYHTVTLSHSPGGNTVHGVEVGAAQEEGSTHGVEDHSFLYVMN